MKQFLVCVFIFALLVPIMGNAESWTHISMWKDRVADSADVDSVAYISTGGNPCRLGGYVYSSGVTYGAALPVIELKAIHNGREFSLRLSVDGATAATVFGFSSEDNNKFLAIGSHVDDLVLTYAGVITYCDSIKVHYKKNGATAGTFSFDLYVGVLK